MSQSAGTDPESPTAGVVEVEHLSPNPLDEVWKRLVSTDGVEALLGEGARLGGKGEPWRAGDGTHGVTRSYHPAEQVRVSWHAGADGPATMVDLRMSDAPPGTRLQLRHEHLPPDAPHEQLRSRWEAALARLAD